VIVTNAAPSGSATNFTVADYASILGGSVGYIGFTGGDGGSKSYQLASNFSFTPVAPPVWSIVSSGSNFTLSRSGVDTA